MQGASLKEHGHTHEHMEHPGFFADREPPLLQRELTERAFTVGIGGPVGSGYVVDVRRWSNSEKHGHTLVVKQMSCQELSGQMSSEISCAHLASAVKCRPKRCSEFLRYCTNERAQPISEVVPNKCRFPLLPVPYAFDLTSVSCAVRPH